MNVYSYSRVSTHLQADEGISLDEQQRRAQGQALIEGWTIAEAFVERGVSGSMPFAERPEGARLLAKLQPGDVVIAAKLDRVFRSALDCLTVIKDFQSRKISLWLLDMGGDVSGNGIAKLMLTMVSAFAEFERDRISERIRDTKRQLRVAGKLQGGNRPFGFQIDAAGKLVADPREQAAIERIKTLHVEGRSLREIAAALTADGIAINHSTVRRILARPTREAGQ